MQTGAKRPITHDVYDSWRAIQDSTLSRDGVWLAYVLAPQDGDGELVMRNVRTGAERRHARGREPVVTADGRFVIFAVAPLDTEVDKAKKERRSRKSAKAGGEDGEPGERRCVHRRPIVTELEGPEESSRYVAWLHEPSPAPRRTTRKTGPAPQSRRKTKREEKRAWHRPRHS